MDLVKVIVYGAGWCLAFLSLLCMSCNSVRGVPDLPGLIIATAMQVQNNSE